MYARLRRAKATKNVQVCKTRSSTRCTNTLDASRVTAVPRSGQEGGRFKGQTRPQTPESLQEKAARLKKRRSTKLRRVLDRFPRMTKLRVRIHACRWNARFRVGRDCRGACGRGARNNGMRFYRASSKCVCSQPGAARSLFASGGGGGAKAPPSSLLSCQKPKNSHALPSQRSVSTHRMYVKSRTLEIVATNSSFTGYDNS